MTRIALALAYSGSYLRATRATKNDGRRLNPLPPGAAPVRPSPVGKAPVRLSEIGLSDTKADMIDDTLSVVWARPWSWRWADPAR